MRAYSGKAPFVFCLFAPENRAAARELLQELNAGRYRIWFRQHYNDYQEDEIEAERLESCAGVLLFVSEEFQTSEHCKNILSMAVGKNKKLLPVLLGAVQLSLGIAMHLASKNYLRRDKLSREQYLKAVKDCDWLAPCIAEDYADELSELEAIRYRRAEEKARWLRQWEEESETQLENCRRKWQQLSPGGELLLIAPEEGQNQFLRGREMPVSLGEEQAALVRFENGAYILHCLKTLKLDGVRLSCGEECSAGEFSLLETDGKKLLMLCGETVETIRSQGRLRYLESLQREELMLLPEGRTELRRDRPWKRGTLSDVRISKKHAEILSTPEGCSIEDVGTSGKGSTNGTWITNGNWIGDEPIPPRRPQSLAPGNRIFLGGMHTCLIYREITLTED